MHVKISTDVDNFVGDAISTRYDLFDVAFAARQVFGVDAALAVAFSALDARLDGRDCDFRFWASVFHELSDK